MLPFVLFAQLTLPSPLPPVLELANSFSRTTQPPRCQRRGASGEDLGSSLAMFCVWSVPDTTHGQEKLTATLYGPGAPTLVQWELITSDQHRAVRLVDSVGSYLRNHDFESRPCGEGVGPAGRIVGVQWQGRGLAVHIARLVPNPGYQSKLAVMATDVPASLPALICQ